MNNKTNSHFELEAVTAHVKRVPNVEHNIGHFKPDVFWYLQNRLHDFDGSTLDLVFKVGVGWTTFGQCTLDTSNLSDNVRWEYNVGPTLDQCCKFTINASWDHDTGLTMI